MLVKRGCPIMDKRIEKGRMDKQDFDRAYSVARNLVKRSRSGVAYKEFSMINHSIVAVAIKCVLSGIYESDNLEDRRDGHYKRRYDHKLATGSDCPDIDEIPF